MSNDDAIHKELIKGMKAIENQISLLNRTLGFILDRHLPPPAPSTAEPAEAIVVEKPADPLIRNIPSVVYPEGTVFTPGKKRPTPSVIVRLDALIASLYKEMNNGQQMKPSDLKEVREQFRKLTRRCRVLMLEDGVTQTFWNDFSTQQKTFYASKLEQKISDYGYPIQRCKKQWASRLLIQEIMKTDRQTRKRQIKVRHRLESSEFNSSILLCILEERG
ncbi:hypothetical protein BDB01DRAFT_471751 [Pilobolus umbonatus]|nr:hypothetical protein BDB01DRAFT_471751 [Pilobolus umbonatus]